MSYVELQKIIEKMNLDVVVEAKYPMPDITITDLNRPGLALAGFFDYFAFDRIQILGKTEISFLKNLPIDIKKSRIDTFFSYDIPCVIITRNLKASDYFINCAEKNKKYVLSTDMSTTRFMGSLTDFLDKELAPQTTIHGVLVDIYGIGVLIIGESGIGKSETAIELVKRGHRLIADDAVEIKEVAKNILIGTAPEILKHYLEVRGLGVIDVKTIFGVGSIRDDIKIEMVIEMVEWDKYEEADRLGIQEEKINILDSWIPKKTVPIRPGRNLAAILEVAAMDFRLKALGHNAALVLSKRISEEIKKN